jgi:DNA modification methylase
MLRKRHAAARRSKNGLYRGFMAPIRTQRVGAVVEVELARLHEWSKNPRRISQERLEQLKHALIADRSMLFARPLICLLDGTVIAGNMRLRAARELGWDTIPVVFVDLSRDVARVWALRDNNAYGEWDEPKLAEILGDLAVRNVDLALAGFGDGDLDRILAHLEPAADPDDAPELGLGPPESEPGAIYELGEHRLLCGDATDAEALGRLFGSERATCMWIDPPYGVGYVGKTERKLRIANDDHDAGVLVSRALSAVSEYLLESAPFYVCAPGGPMGTDFRLALAQSGFRLHQTLVWVKQAIVLGRLDHQAQHEEILYGWAPGPGRPGRGRHAGSRWTGPNNVSSVFFCDRPARSDVHPTMKPVSLIAAQLRNSTHRADVVVDLFAGSGSTLIACEEMGRRAFCIELDPRYCDVIRRRYAEYVRA